MIKIFQYDEVPLDIWINSYILYSKALFLNGKIDSSLALLGFCIDIFPCFPIKDLKFVGEIQKNNKNNIKSNIFDQEILGSFYNRINIFNKCSNIFKENSIFNDPSEEDKKIYDYDYIENNYHQDNDTNNKILSPKIFDENKDKVMMNDYQTFNRKDSIKDKKIPGSSKIKEGKNDRSSFSDKKKINSNYVSENFINTYNLNFNVSNLK
jgi:hypothetical protein